MTNLRKQWTLGELFHALKEIPLIISYPNGDVEPRRVRFDFGDFVPTELMSYRGFYDHLAISFEEDNAQTLEEFIAKVHGAIGASFEGYKGGTYIMMNDTPLWVSRYGRVSQTAVVGVYVNGCDVILLTEFCSW